MEKTMKDISKADNCGMTRFRNSETVCFIGDSITHAGLYHKYIHAFYLTKFPNEAFYFRNCGTAGDNTVQALRRADHDVLRYKPDAAAIMLGMNDAVQAGLGPGPLTRQKLEKIGKAKKQYISNMESLVLKLAADNVRIILITPSPYEQTAKIETENEIGCNDALGIFSEALKELAEKYGLAVCDFYNPMNRIAASIQSRDPAATIIGLDRVHPGTTGHWIMAYLFLKDQGLQDVLPEIQIDASAGSFKRVLNCEASSIEIKTGRVTYSYRPLALPLFADDGHMEADRLVPLSVELNREMLQVEGLTAGTYIIRMNGEEVARYTSGQLEKGINLALELKNPGSGITEGIYRLLDEKSSLDNRIRQLDFIDKDMIAKKVDFNDKSAFEAFRADYLKGAEGYPWYGYCCDVFESYIRDKPLEEELRAGVERILDEINGSKRDMAYRVEIMML